MIISKKEIIRLVKNGEINIEPFSPASLLGNGYGLCIKGVSVSKGRVMKNRLVIPPRSLSILHLRESVKMSENVCGHLSIIPKYSLMGLMGNCVWINAGWEGYADIPCYNASGEYVHIEQNTPVVEIIFVTLEKEKGEKNESVCTRYQCDLCCVNTEMPLTESDISRITAMGYNMNEFAEESDNWVRLKNTPDGQCYFLKNSRCSIYENRPEGCRIYPVILDGDKPVLDPDCPYRDEFELNENIKNQLYRVVERLDRERRGGFLPHKLTNRTN